MERDRVAGLDAEFIEKRSGIGDAVAPRFGFGAELEDVRGVFGANMQLSFLGFHLFDGGERDFQAQVAAEEDLGGLEQDLTAMRFPIGKNGAGEFLSHE